MGISKPYHRNFRPVKKDVHNSGYSSSAYIRVKGYAKNPQHYIRAYLYIQKDLEKIFEFIEPSDKCLQTFSFRIHELLMRTCIELEANFKAILKENIYTPETDRFGNSIYNIRVYKKINQTHRLSDYVVTLPMWNGSIKEFKPFEGWANCQNTLSWYQAYNASKHDRSNEFEQANLENLLNAVAGLLVLISSQFGTEDFSAAPDFLSTSTYSDEDGESSIGWLFKIKFPDTWTDQELYDFDWQLLEQEKDITKKFQKFDYDKI